MEQEEVGPTNPAVTLSITVTIVGPLFTPLVLDRPLRGIWSTVPLTKSWDWLGFNPTTGRTAVQIKVENGVDLFAKLPGEDRETILGKAAFLAYKSGAVNREDFVGRNRDRL